MFEDLTEPQITKEDLKAKIKELQEVLKESRDFVIDQQNTIDTLKHQFSESFQDAKKYAQHIKELHDRIQDEGLEQIFQDIPIPD